MLSQESGDECYVCVVMLMCSLDNGDLCDNAQDRILPNELKVKYSCSLLDALRL